MLTISTLAVPAVLIYSLQQHCEYLLISLLIHLSILWYRTVNLLFSVNNNNDVDSEISVVLVECDVVVYIAVITMECSFCVITSYLHYSLLLYFYRHTKNYYMQCKLLSLFYACYWCLWCRFA